jgi:transcriptional regulator with PAS, ATPase and Fis domain
MRVLLSWLGKMDLELMQADKLGALAAIAVKLPIEFDAIVILINNWHDQVDDYGNWLKKKLALNNKSNDQVVVIKSPIDNPTDYDAISQFMHAQLDELTTQCENVTINLTSGTPTMTAVSVLLGKGIYNCSFAQSFPNGEVETTKIPIDFNAKYRQVSERNIESIASSSPKVERAFSKIIAHSTAMKECVKKAKKLSQTRLPALILGETGTGKEMLANAIHFASDRRNKAFKAINCGALPENLVDSVLFGHVKGAFTGAINDQKGLFQQADGGTLFLDEVGELTPAVQVKLLRALQQQEITPI